MDSDDDVMPLPLSRSGFNAVVARINRSPRELYWRFRLLQGVQPNRPPRGRTRAVVLDAAQQLVAADPGLFVSRGLPAFALDGWSIEEAESILEAFHFRPREAERWARASFWSRAANRSLNERAFLLAARRELDAIPRRSRRRGHAEFLLDVLLRLDPAELAAVIDRHTAELDLDSPIIASRLLQWLTPLAAAGHDEAAAHLESVFSRLPTHLKSARDRVAFHNHLGERALGRGDWRTVKRVLREMTVLAPQADFLGNADTMSLARALASQRKLLSQVASYLEAVLLSDWRRWVRPGLKQLLRSVRARS